MGPGHRMRLDLLLPLLPALPVLPALPLALGLSAPGGVLAEGLPAPMVPAPMVPAPMVPAPPPLLPPPLPGLGQVLPPGERPDPSLEAALRQRLFDGPFDLVPGKEPDPDGTEWQQARTKGVRPLCAEVGEMRYLHTAVDLDGDGQAEVVAAVVGSYACGSRGCSLFVFRRALPGLELVNELDLFESPLTIDGQSRYGWQNLTMPAALALGGPPGELVHLVFDGRRYGRSDVAPPQAPPGATSVVLQMEPVPFEQLGHPLPCGP